MRASVMLHLPALEKSRAINRIAGNLSKLGLTIRGAHGEGTSPKGEIYQLSNQITLGISEEEALDNLQSIALQLVAQERAAAQSLMENPAQEDKMWRALGILKNARMLSCDEFMDVDIKKLNEITYSVQPATINAHEGRELTAQQRDIMRADMVRKAFA